METDPRPALTAAIEIYETKGALSPRTLEQVREMATATPVDLGVEDWGLLLASLERVGAG